MWTADRAAEWIAAWDAARTAAHTKARSAEWIAAQRKARDAAPSAAYSAAWDVIAALVAWDHCDQYLTMTPDQMATWSALSSDPAAVLLRPYVQLLAAVATKQQVDSNTQTCYN
jgi:hypothetical protein